jgi:hypothetical protein
MQLSNHKKSKIVDTGMLTDAGGKETPYEVRHGWDLASSFQCDTTWARSNTEFFEYIVQQNYDDDELKEVLASIQLGDNHWDWSAKSLHSKSDGYEWFYLYANQEPQGACLIFQPRDSALESSKIFYVKFVAVAPWNRDCSIREKLYKGVGTTLLLSALKVAVDTLGLTPGFSLHSLPQAEGYYAKLKMIRVATEDEGSLAYFELPSVEAIEMVGKI